MATNDKQKLSDAYKLVRDAETAAIQAVADLAKEFQDKLQAISDALPFPDSAAQQYISRVRASTVNVFGFDLQNMKGAYGLNDNVAADAKTTPAV